jgi:hypothetical protein
LFQVQVDFLCHRFLLKCFNLPLYQQSRNPWCRRRSAFGSGNMWKLVILWFRQCHTIAILAILNSDVIFPLIFPQSLRKL